MQPAEEAPLLRARVSSSALPPSLGRALSLALDADKRGIQRAAARLASSRGASSADGASCTRDAKNTGTDMRPKQTSW